jgi:hypothetical protein
MTGKVSAIRHQPCRFDAWVGIKERTRLLSASANHGSRTKSEVEMGQQDKPGVWRPLGGEGFQSRAAEDDDVEGHAFTRGATERGQTRAHTERVGGDDDVEGHAFTRGATERGQTRGQTRASGDEDDVEGHGQTRGATERGQTRGQTRGASERISGDEDDDVEGHKQKQ